MTSRTTALNLIGLLVAAPLLGYSLAHAGPLSFAVATESMLANATVGVSAGVEPNPYNGVAQQLNAKEAELESREQALNSKTNGRGDTLGLYSFLMSAILLVLIAINFYLDMRRRRAPAVSQYAVDLR